MSGVLVYYKRQTGWAGSVCYIIGLYPEPEAVMEFGGRLKEYEIGKGGMLIWKVRKYIGWSFPGFTDSLLLKP